MEMRKSVKITERLSSAEYLTLVLEWKSWKTHHKRLTSAIRGVLMENDSLKKRLDELEKERRG